ncbi:MAG: AI-2E family transporter [Candidatus Nanohaloarchaea archaeon]
MEEVSERTQNEIFLVAGVLFFLSLYVLYPFLDAIIMGVAVAYLLRFAHDWINARLNNDLLSSVIVVTGVLALVGMSLYFFINNFFYILSQVNQFTGSIQQGVTGVIELLNLSPSFQANVENFIDRVSDRTTRNMIGLFTSIPSLLIDLAIFLFTAIYLYRDRSKIQSQIQGVMRNLPESEQAVVRSILESIDHIFRGVFMTQFIVAILIGVLSGLGLYVISLITSPIPFIPLIAFLIGIAALLPLIASFMFYAPVGAYYIMVNQPFKGMLIILFGVLGLNVLTEVLIRPYVGSRQMDEHPLVIFLGFLAGPLVLGLKGLILGPLLLILTKEFILNSASIVYGGDHPTHIGDTESH